MAKPSRLDGLTKDITRDVLEHPHDLSKFISEKEGITRAAAARYILQLERDGWIARSGPSTRPVFIPGYRRRVSKQYKLTNLEEDLIWTSDFRPYFNLSSNVLNIVTHGFTEMVNNAIDHSAGTSIFISASLLENSFTLAVSDNGIGIFEKISKFIIF